MDFSDLTWFHFTY